MKSAWKWIARVLLIIVGILITLVFVLVIYSSPYGKTLQLKKNQANWERRNITHYRFKLEFICLCYFEAAMPVTIEVNDGQIISMIDKKGLLVEGNDRKYFEEVGTIDRVFRLAEQGISNAYACDVDYDNKLGFPTFVYVDPDKDWIDDETGYQLSNFETLP